MADYGYKGWIKLWREEMHNPLYFEEPFTKWQAWMDLCMMADNEGRIKTSLEALKNRWSWTSVKKVRNFLGTVEGIGLGTVKGTPHKGTLIRINTGLPPHLQKAKGQNQGTVKGTVKGTEEVLLKEVVPSASLEEGRGTEWIEDINKDLGEEYE